MKTRFIEAIGIQPGGAPGNHGKFSVGWFEAHEWARQSEVDADMGEVRSLLGRTGWTGRHFVVSDLQTGESAIFLLGGHAANDLDKHAIWVCPLFEPFLEWLYVQWNEWCAQMLASKDPLPSPGDFLPQLPKQVKVDYPMELSGRRRNGPFEALARELAEALEDEIRFGKDNPTSWGDLRAKAKEMLT